MMMMMTPHSSPPIEIQSRSEGLLPRHTAIGRSFDVLPYRQTAHLVGLLMVPAPPPPAMLLESSFSKVTTLPATSFRLADSIPRVPIYFSHSTVWSHCCCCCCCHLVPLHPRKRIHPCSIVPGPSWTFHGPTTDLGRLVSMEVPCARYATTSNPSWSSLDCPSESDKWKQQHQQQGTCPRGNSTFPHLGSPKWPECGMVSNHMNLSNRHHVHCSRSW
mmetsp:Transcript_27157/g.65921  ORF Transcript_27157/g.65921 Transcript_27157/m.65921 type:complete len:217 (-) Transcript_27157:1522-2172(-)